LPWRSLSSRPPVRPRRPTPLRCSASVTDASLKSRMSNRVPTVRSGSSGKRNRLRNLGRRGPDIGRTKTTYNRSADPGAMPSVAGTRAGAQAAGIPDALQPESRTQCSSAFGTATFYSLPGGTISNPGGQSGRKRCQRRIRGRFRCSFVYPTGASCETVISRGWTHCGFATGRVCNRRPQGRRMTDELRGLIHGLRERGSFSKRSPRR
jgi:hypothetical protein